MKKLAFFIIVLPCLLSPINSFSQTTKLNFTTEITSTENVPIPDVYIKIYLPEIVYAVDSFFTDGEGKTEKELSINFGTGLPFFKAGKEAFFITKALSPNIASSKISNYFLEYSHQKEGRLSFMDVQGRIYPNHTELEAGIYFYFLDFEDGQKSELNKFIVSEKCVLNVGLRNNKQSQQNQPNNSRKSELENRIIIEVLKDGFITQKDTIPVETTEIERNYQLEFAMLPTAGFSWSGELKVGKPVIFDASSSYGANAESLVYSWDFGDRLKGQSAGIPHVYSNPGEYLVKLTVRGDFGAKHSLSKTISIEASATAVHSDGIINAYINDEDGTSLENVKLSLVEEEMEGFTNENGVAYLAGLPVGIPVHLKITKDDYVNQMVEVTVPEDSKQADIFISLKSRMPAILLSNAEFGGDVMGIEGAKLKLPVEALVKQDGSVAKGDVTVNVTPIDVAFEAESFPGSFEAFRDDGEDGVLLSYGVSEFHFKQGEEELQLAEGKTAIVHIPIYTGGATLGDEIPLWSVNEENGNRREPEGW